MNLKGVLDFSLGNFLCLRGFAKMGDLYSLSEPDLSFQRDLFKLHEKEMVSFLSEGEFLFFPEVILSTTLSPDIDNTDEVTQLFENVRAGQKCVNLKFPDYKLSSSVNRTKSKKDSRFFDNFQTATLELNENPKKKFSRIDGNHRLSATPKNNKFKDHNTPFCLLFFRNTTEAARFSCAIFHNINYKLVPLTMEQNLKLILDDTSLFSDEKLKESESFGWPYFHARKLYNGLDFEVLSNLRPFISLEPRSFLVNQFTFLAQKHVLDDNENAVSRFKGALSKINGLFDTNPALKGSKNRGLLAALVYYVLQKESPVTSFLCWVLDNHLHLIENSSSEDLIKIFNKVLESRRRTIFVAMPFGKTKTDDHYAIIQRVCKEVSTEHKLNPEIKVERVDWFYDGTSYEINDKIIEMVSDCGLLIGNLTHCNPNVYHEIGFVMGKAKAEGMNVANMLLFLDESVADENDKFVGFNLRGIKQIRFTSPETEFAPELSMNIKRFFRLTSL
ncbi:MAG: hypothetical protein ACYCXP_10375 [Leptospirillum sp.]